ncbi:MAG: efflux RND transporter permease subunit [Acidobacteriota bacterium]
MKFFVEHPVTTSMFFLAVIVLGIYSTINIPVELAPKEDYPRITIETLYPGAPPENVQTSITSPLEEISSTVRGVRKITSTSSIGRSQIVLEFNEKTNMDFASVELGEKIASFIENIPAGAYSPRIIPYIPKEFEIKPFLSFTISGDYTLHELRQIAEERIKIPIRSIKGVSDVLIRGGSQPEIKIIVEKEKLDFYNMYPQEIISNLIQNNKIFPAGKIKKEDKEYVFKVSQSIREIKDLKNTVVKYFQGIPIRLGNIAKVEQSFEDVQSIRRINGEPTVEIEILKEPGESTLRVAKRVKEKLIEIQKQVPKDLTFRFVEDESKEIKKRLQNLYFLIALIISIIFILLYIFIGRILPSILILSSIIFSVFLTMNLIYFFKIPLNLLTLSGLALGFGMFVDNSVVVFESIYRKREEGLATKESALLGSKVVLKAVLAATLTTIAVFFAFPYFQGRLRIYYLPLAFVISFSLISSFFIAFSLIPSLSLKFSIKKIDKKGWKITQFYEKFVKFSLKRSLIFILLIAAIFYLTFKWFRKEVSFGTFFQWYIKDTLNVHVTMPPGTPIEKTDEVIKQFENKVLEKQYRKEVNTYVFPERAFIRITFPSQVERSFIPYVLKEELINLATNFAGIGISVYGFDPQSYYSGLYGGSYLPFRIKFYGYNFKKLKDITSQVEKTLLKSPRIKETKIVSSRWYWSGLDYYEVAFKINRDNLNKYKISPSELSQFISSAIPGRTGSRRSLKLDGKEILFSVKIKEAEDMDIEKLKNIVLRTTKGELLRLNEIADLEEIPIEGDIEREDQRFQQIVMWDYRGPYKAGERYQKAIFNNLTLPSGFSATLEELWRITLEEEKKIEFAIIISLLLIFMILASLFESIVQPFVVLLSVPLALIGVFIAFIVADFPFDSSAYIGLILMGGIVVNNAILMVDSINHKRTNGFDFVEAIVKGASERIRPIFIATTTTILGMLPFVIVVFQVEQKRNIWSTLALSITGGLISSTVFILLFIPIFYYLSEKIKISALKKLRYL